MKWRGLLWLFLIPVLWSSCRSDFETIESSGNLEFSKDTVYLDTVFSNIGSATYSLKVYNRTNEDLLIPKIRLSLGETSGYRLNVDGLSGKSFEDIEILAKDSLYVFIETTVDFQELNTAENQFLYSDAIEFSSEVHQQKIPLITLVKDAVFLYPTKDSEGIIETIDLGRDPAGEEVSIQGFFLEDEELRFTHEKPYVIYGYAAVPPNKVLEIEAGARIHFHANSGIIISEGAAIQAKGEANTDPGTTEKQIIFEGDRLQPEFNNIPGQWGTIWFREAGGNSFLNHTIIRNATVGLLLDNKDEEPSSPLLIANTQIYNSSTSGILARNANIVGENLVINNSGQASLHLALGGSYRFKHSTFANYWNNGYRNYPAVYISNAWQTPEQTSYKESLKAHFSNCIIYGNQTQELLINLQEAPEASLSFDHCLLRSGAAVFSDLAEFDNVIFYEDPLFRNPAQNDLQLSEESPARNMGNPATALEVPRDILKVNRALQPDIGAYEWTPSEESEDNEGE
ncbi:hypothetical protein GCM10007103_18350 [Salinimicrobium marinum]|uniref:Right handed beta helix domain-containing protein n=1 Tax=Salinimicrobium marinum TaxID=680283 RepID=A0A918SGJ7_9FLAO|nr:right-handed parallel beta-helix repeat-containing protein [Salinimicrobium marinum]GHA37321.1 hypothetical protein GCM10007103_18350 [Salinimicrobium marinum]